jgi:hypothetical protein
MGRKRKSVIEISAKDLLPAEIYNALVSISFATQIKLGTSPEHTALIENNDEHWQILAMWISYERSPNIDIGRYPYNTPEFRAARPLARLINQQLELCKPVFEANRDKLPFENPMHWWVFQMQEKRYLERVSIFSPPPKPTVLKHENEDRSKRFGRSVTGKTQFVEGCKSHLKSLEKDRKVSEEIEGTEYGRFLDMALTMAYGKNRDTHTQKCRDFRKEHWNPYLEKLKNFVRDAQNNQNLQLIYIENGQIFQSAKHSPQRLSIPPIVD